MSKPVRSRNGCRAADARNRAAAEIDVQLVAVTPGVSAELTISGSSPIAIGIGETIEGVTVLSRIAARPW